MLRSCTRTSACNAPPCSGAVFPVLCFPQWRCCSRATTVLHTWGCAARSGGSDTNSTTGASAFICTVLKPLRTAATCSASAVVTPRRGGAESARAGLSSTVSSTSTRAMAAGGRKQEQNALARRRDNMLSPRVLLPEKPMARTSQARIAMLEKTFMCYRLAEAARSRRTQTLDSLGLHAPRVSDSM